jgi:hypothetical protein
VVTGPRAAAQFGRGDAIEPINAGRTAERSLGRLDPPPSGGSPNPPGSRRTRGCGAVLAAPIFFWVDVWPPCDWAAIGGEDCGRVPPTCRQLSPEVHAGPARPATWVDHGFNATTPRRPALRPPVGHQPPGYRALWPPTRWRLVGRGKWPGAGALERGVERWAPSALPGPARGAGPGAGVRGPRGRLFLFEERDATLPVITLGTDACAAPYPSVSG